MREGQATHGQPSQDWINKAAPEDLITTAKSVFGRIGQLDQTYRDRFVSEVRSDPAAAKVLDQLTPA